MNPTIIIESDSNDLSTPPRELLCSVWPISRDGDDLAIGNPIFSNHMVLVGASPSEETGSVLTLPAAGLYLVDIGYPNGKSQRTTISVNSSQPYLLILDSPMKRAATPPTMESALSFVPRVISAAARRKKTKQSELEVSVINQTDQASICGLYDFLNNLAKPIKQRENIFEQATSNALSHEILLSTSQQDQPISFAPTNERKWIMLRCKGKSQTLIAYPYGWSSENSEPFKLLIGRKNKQNNDFCKWKASLKLMDPVYGSMVEHLTRRDIYSTLLISESERGKSTTDLYKKSGNPFSAAVAAYIFALDRSENPRHLSWMKNLSSKYSWLPDAPIALGWKRLYEGQNDELAWNEARELFFLACSRGLPYYTVGLHILVDALTLLCQVNPDDQDTLDMLAAAKAVDVVCVRTEPFTTLQIPKYLGLPMKRT